MPGLRVGVVGCGSAGPAAAILLADGGHTPVVFERAPVLAPVGAGFLLQPTGLDVLARIGIRDPVLACTAPVRRLRAETARGRPVLDLDYEMLGAGVYGLGVHRAALLDLLAGALAARGVPLRLGVDIETIESRSDSVHLVASDGERHGPFDLVVLADGARSRLRETPGLRFRVREYPWGAVWIIAEDPERSFEGELYQVLDGARTMLGFLPTGRRIDPARGAPAGAPLTSLFWSIRSDRVEALHRRGLDAWKSEVLRLAPRAEALLARVREPEQLLFARYFDVVMHRPHAGRVVVLGDAAHAMSPQLGQGVNLGLQDAEALARAIADEPDLAHALSGYARSRRAQLAFYQRATRWLTPFFQSDLPLGTLRDLGLPAFQALPALRRQMLRTMAGLKRGVVRRSLPANPVE